MTTTEAHLTSLLDRARTGDAEALNSLLREVQPRLYRFSMKMCRHTEDAEDVLQDTMLTLARTFKDFRGASSLSTWLYSVARSICIKKRRKSKFAPSVEESLENMDPRDRAEVSSPDRNPEEAATASEVWERVQIGIQKLAPLDREVLVLRDVEGLRAKAVAEITGSTVSAVKSRLHRARAELRESLTEHAYTVEPGCPDIRDVFSRYLEGEISADMCSSMEAHVAICSHCAAECSGLRSVLNACSTSPREVPSHVQASVQEALREALSGRSIKRAVEAKP